MVISLLALSEQRSMRQAGTDPVVIPHLKSREDAPILVQVALTNVGAGAATNIRLEVDYPENAEDCNLINTPFQSAILSGQREIGVLLQGGTISWNLGMGFNLLGQQPLKPFTVRVYYRDIEGSAYRSEHTIDVRELDGIAFHDPTDVRIAKALEKIQQGLKS